LRDIVRLPEFENHALGVHILLDLKGCDKRILKSAKRIEEAMIEAAKKARATIVGYQFHEFSPYGTSGMVIIAESHLSIHSWPEYHSAAIDIFTCGDLGCDVAANYLYHVFRAKDHDIKIVPRLTSKKARPHKINIESGR